MPGNKTCSAQKKLRIFGIKICTQVTIILSRNHSANIYIQHAYSVPGLLWALGIWREKNRQSDFQMVQIKCCEGADDGCPSTVGCVPELSQATLGEQKLLCPVLGCVHKPCAYSRGTFLQEQEPTTQRLEISSDDG